MAHFLKNTLLTTVTAISLLSGLSVFAEERKIIELTQIPCQFVESENGINHGYSTTKKSDCKAINNKFGDKRAAEAKALVVEEGSYTFRVHNKGVPYDLGFWIRGDGALNRLKLPSTSGGGLAEGTSKDYNINLVPGNYVYSCPLNPTLNYKLIVKPAQAS